MKGSGNGKRRWQQPGTWFWIPNELLQRQLPHRALLVYMALGYHANSKTQRAWPGQRKIAKMLRMSMQTVNHGIKDLVTAGFISKQHQRGKTSQYTLLHQASYLGVPNMSSVSPTVTPQTLPTVTSVTKPVLKTGTRKDGEEHTASLHGSASSTTATIEGLPTKRGVTLATLPDTPNTPNARGIMPVMCPKKVLRLAPPGRYSSGSKLLRFDSALTSRPPGRKIHKLLAWIGRAESMVIEMDGKKWIWIGALVARVPVTPSEHTDTRLRFRWE